MHKFRPRITSITFFLLLVCSISHLAAAAAGTGPDASAHGPTTFAPGFNDYDKIQREHAATYRLELARFKAPPGYNEAAQARLDQINALLESGDYKVARKLAKHAYLKEFPYSTHAADLLYALICSHLPEYLPEGKKHKLYTSIIYSRLNELWLRFPNFTKIRTLFEKVLEATELIQNYGTVINIHAETVEDAVSYSWGLHLNAALDLFTFLERNGDKHNVAPRASLGIARILLLQGVSDPKKLAAARSKYLEFIDLYPHNELVFTALIERAYSHLLAYRGDKYDVGVLIEASYILKQAELYTQNDSTRINLIQKLRDLIRRSHQARDYQVAIWYQAKGHTEPAIYYFNEVVKRDPNSSKGLDAARILSQIDQSAKNSAQ